MLNDLGQPVGEPLPGWTPPPYVPEEVDEKPRRRALVAVPVVMALVAAIAVVVVTRTAQLTG